MGFSATDYSYCYRLAKHRNWLPWPSRPGLSPGRENKSGGRAKAWRRTPSHDLDDNVASSIKLLISLAQQKGQVRQVGLSLRRKRQPGSQGKGLGAPRTPRHQKGNGLVSMAKLSRCQADKKTERQKGNARAGCQDLATSARRAALGR